eukprot:m.251673 g.251673  ORF g.251673 m.251673 type:complete len:206 (-) comp17185_c1_seq4:3764-4381(-)
MQGGVQAPSACDMMLMRRNAIEQRIQLDREEEGEASRTSEALSWPLRLLVIVKLREEQEQEEQKNKKKKEEEKQLKQQQLYNNSNNNSSSSSRRCIFYLNIKLSVWTNSQPDSNHIAFSYPCSSTPTFTSTAWFCFQLHHLPDTGWLLQIERCSHRRSTNHNCFQCAAWNSCYRLSPTYRSVHCHLAAHHFDTAAAKFASERSHL